MGDKSVPEFEPPQACVSRIIKNVLPENVQVTKDARAAFSRAAGVFIFYLTHCANDFSKDSNRSTIYTSDVESALKELEFTEFQEPLEAFLKAYRKEVSASKNKAKGSKAAAGAAADDEGEGEGEGEQEADESAEAEAETTGAIVEDGGDEEGAMDVEGDADVEGDDVEVEGEGEQDMVGSNDGGDAPSGVNVVPFDDDEAGVVDNNGDEE